MESQGTIKRITANLPESLLAAAQASTREGITETLVEGLDHIFRLEARNILARLQRKTPESMVIFADTSALRNWLLSKEEIPVLDFALLAGALRVPDMVAAELSADADLGPVLKDVDAILFRIPKIPADGGRWKRVATLKSHLHGKGRNVSTVDAELVQMALDHGAYLVTRNPTLKDIHKVCGVKVYL